jgi:hypothetical protein
MAIGGVVLREEILPEISREIPPHDVLMIGVVLRVVVLATPLSLVLGSPRGCSVTSTCGTTKTPTSIFDATP